MMLVEPAGLIGRALDLEPAGSGVRRNRLGAAFGGFEPPLAQAEGIPVDAEPSSEHEENG